MQTECSAESSAFGRVNFLRDFVIPRSIGCDRAGHFTPYPMVLNPGSSSESMGFPVLFVCHRMLALETPQGGSLLRWSCWSWCGGRSRLTGPARVSSLMASGAPSLPPLHPVCPSGSGCGAGGGRSGVRGGRSGFLCRGL